ncbi:MAG: hypothetical protein QW083_01990 [Methanomassiliicoccales archaeon]
MKIIGIMTEDFKFFHELVCRLKEKGEPFVSLGFSDVIPSAVGVIITTEHEIDKVEFSSIVANDDPHQAIDIALGRLKGGEEFGTLVIGIDPGSRPGIAVFGDRKLIFSEVVSFPEQVAGILDHVLSCYPHSRSVVKIGHGDRTNRNRVIRAIWEKVDEVYVVDESNTTRRTDSPDVDAAVSIALSVGKRICEVPEVTPTAGEIRDIQRLSRLHSQGKVTISSDLAEAVAKGLMSLDEAVELQARKLSR